MIIQQATPPLRNYTKTRNEWIRDGRLSPGAHAVRDWLASHVTGYYVTEKTIVSAFNCGRFAIRRMIKELIEYGYLVRKQNRSEGGRFASIDYIVLDPWAAEAAPEAPAQVALEIVPEIVTEAPEATEDVVSETTALQPVTVIRSAVVGEPDTLRTPETQKTRTTKTKDQNRALLTAVGDVTDRNARATVTTPKANSKDISRMAGLVLAKLPAHYRDVPNWLRKRLFTKIETALHADNSPQAVIVYAAKFLFDDRFNQYEHLIRFDDVIKKLTEDVAYGIACSGCGLDPRHPFCTANTDGGVS